MTDAEFATFFAEICAQLGLRVDGFRRTRGSVRRRVARRMRELGLAGLPDYRQHLDVDPDEWLRLDPLCRITISRFARDAPTYEALLSRHLPELAAAARARGRRRLRVWSAGAASGEEAYGLAIAWHIELGRMFPELGLDVLGTDADPTVLARAERGVYPEGSLRELPSRLRSAFERCGSEWRISELYRLGVRFERADVRRERPAGPFDLVLCRNVAFTYFDDATQRRLAGVFEALLGPGGVLVVGKGEQVPAGSTGLIMREPEIYARAG